MRLAQMWVVLASLALGAGAAAATPATWNPYGVSMNAHAVAKRTADPSAERPRVDIIPDGSPAPKIPAYVLPPAVSAAVTHIRVSPSGGALRIVF